MLKTNVGGHDHAGKFEAHRFSENLVDFGLPVLRAEEGNRHPGVFYPAAARRQPEGGVKGGAVVAHGRLNVDLVE